MRVLNLVNTPGVTSIPVEVAAAISRAWRDEEHEIRCVGFFPKEKGREAGFLATAESVGANARYDLAALMRLVRLVRAWQPDVIHVHHTLTILFGFLLSRLASGVRLVVTEHNHRGSYGFLQKLARWPALVGSDAIVCNSRHTASTFGRWERRFAEGKIRVVHNGVDVTGIRRAATEAAPPANRSDRPLFVSVGRLVRQKNYGRLFRAVAAVNSDGRRIRLQVAGDGSEENRLRRVIEREGAADSVHLLGRVGREEVYELLGRADFFVVASLWEGFCNAAVEAMAAGLPLLCSDIPTLHEVVGDEALYADPRSVEGLAAGLRACLDLSEAERAARGRALRARAEDRYALEQTARAYIEVYRRLAEAPAG